MATTAFQGTPVKTVGDLPEKGAQAPAFSLVGNETINLHLEVL